MILMRTLFLGSVTAPVLAIIFKYKNLAAMVLRERLKDAAKIFVVLSLIAVKSIEVEASHNRKLET